MRSPVSHALPVAALLLAGGHGVAVEARASPASVVSVPTGPAADYPVTLGDPFTIEGKTWTPADRLNYDAVGHAQVRQDGPPGIWGAHKTLPLPSYVEVTSLASGRTTLMRLVERGPMVNESLIALSPSAAEQLGIIADGPTAVRVRRVNPPEVERAQLRAGLSAPRRMDTPESLLIVLRRKLPEHPSRPSTPPAHVETESIRESSQTASVKPAISSPSPLTAAVQVERNPASPKGTHLVQVAAFSTRERAEKAARQLGGDVKAAGRYWRVRLGPFNGSGEAAPALEKAKAAGYSDARIQRVD